LVFDQAVGLVSSFDERQLSVLRALLASRDLLVEELQNLSKAIDQPIDLTDVTAKVDDKTLIDLRAELGIEVDKVLGPDRLQNGIEVCTPFNAKNESGFFHFRLEDEELIIVTLSHFIFPL